VSDNGKGCDLEKEKNGVGIINIRSRAELYYGSVTIVSTPGAGFELKVVLPLFPVPVTVKV
jgi:signal transduction histidine kinase